MIAKNTPILTVCESGEDRSVALAWELKHNRHYDNVLNCGVDKVTPETLTMLCRWADIIIVMADPTVYRRIPATFRSKTKFVDIGFDKWQSPENPDLKKIATQTADKLGL